MVESCLQPQIKPDSKVLDQRKGHVLKRIVRVSVEKARKIMIELQVVVLDSSFVLHYLQTSSAGSERILQGHQRELLCFVAVLLMLKNQKYFLKKEPKRRLSLIDKE
jgi:hypothetical protein